MILIKLGGSIITNKRKPQSARRKTIDNILKQIKKIDEPKILVHGGGSYGHYWSVKYGMHTKPAKYSLKGLSVVKNSMIELDKIILDSAAKNKLNTYSLPPTDFMNGNKPIRNKIQKIGEIAKSGLIPITYGDALWYSQKKSYILSGEVIMTTIGKILKPRLSVFVLDVDGVYSDTKSKKLIYDFKKEKPTISKNKMDVTGGMTRKITEAVKMSKSGRSLGSMSLTSLYSGSCPKFFPYIFLAYLSISQLPTHSCPCASSPTLKPPIPANKSKNFMPHLQASLVIQNSSHNASAFSHQCFSQKPMLLYILWIFVISLPHIPSSSSSSA